MDFSCLKPGQRIFVAGTCNEPTGLLNALREAGKLPEGLHFVQFPVAGYNRIDFTAWHPTWEMTTVFMTPHLRDADPVRLHFLPMQMRTFYDWLAEGIDLALLQVARDREGRLRLGPNADFAGAVLSGGVRVLAELNESFLAPAGCPAIDERRLDGLIRTNRPLHEPPRPAIDPAARAIGRLVAELIQDGDCLQIGVGAVPAAILQALGDKNDLGLHSGLIDDGGMQLAQAGNLTGARKPVDTGQHVVGMALGSRALIDWAAQTPELQFRGANHTHEASVIRHLPGFVSINSALEVDLLGQVNAEMAGGRQISGTGGSVDFMRAAKRSPGGRSIIAMRATARGGARSRIVPRVELATALRTDADMVVTEHGVARLNGLPVKARSQALAAIAAPAFQDQLLAAAKQL